jgi:hypothetical protein
VQETANHIIREDTPLRQEAAPVNSEKPKLLDPFRDVLRFSHYSRHTEQTCAHWVKRFIHCHNIRICKPTRLPVVMTREEEKSVLANLTGDKWLMASIMYSANYCWAHRTQFHGKLNHYKTVTMFSLALKQF